MATSTGRTRVRALAVDNTPSPVTPEMRQLAIKAHTANLKKNEGTRDESSARAALMGIMVANKVSTFDVTAKINDKMVSLTTLYTPEGTSEGKAVDAQALLDLVGLEEFMKVVSVTQAAVTEQFGTAMLNRVVKDTTGVKAASVTVKPSK